MQIAAGCKEGGERGRASSGRKRGEALGRIQQELLKRAQQEVSVRAVNVCGVSVQIFSLSNSSSSYPSSPLLCSS